MREDGKSHDIMPEMYCLESVVHGYPVYKRAWTPVVGNKLPVDISTQGSCSSNVWLVVDHVPRACSLASSIDEDSRWQVNACKTNIN